MDKNFSDILGIFKKLNESSGEHDHAPGECKTCDDRRAAEEKQKRKEEKTKQKTDESKQPQASHSLNCPYNYGHDCTCGMKEKSHANDCGWNYGHDCDCGLVNEGSMAGAAKHQSGSKFGGYWKGTDKNTPKPGMSVGSMEESLRAKWDKFKTQEVDEDGSITAVGATGTATGTQNAAKAPNPAEIAQDANKIKQGLTGKLPAGVDANKLSTALATAGDTNKPLAGNQAQTVTNTLAPSLAKIAQDPSQANQLGQLIKKAGQQ